MIIKKLNSMFHKHSRLLFGLFTVLIIIIFQLCEKRYLSADNIRNILYSVSVTGVLMVGIANLLISGNMDLSAGAVGCFCTILGCKLINLGVPWVIAALLTICFGICCGLLNAFMTYKLGIIPFIGTLGIASVWSGLGAVITKQASVTLTNESFFKFGSTKFGIIPIAFLYVVFLCVLYGLCVCGRCICRPDRSCTPPCGRRTSRPHSAPAFRPV